MFGRTIPLIFVWRPRGLVQCDHEFGEFRLAVDNLITSHDLAASGGINDRSVFNVGDGLENPLDECGNVLPLLKIPLVHRIACALEGEGRKAGYLDTVSELYTMQDRELALNYLIMANTIHVHVHQNHEGSQSKTESAQSEESAYREMNPVRPLCRSCSLEPEGRHVSKQWSTEPKEEKDGIGRAEALQSHFVSRIRYRLRVLGLGHEGDEPRDGQD